MKINVEIDCTPEEARAFLGLPDFRPIHEKFVEEMQKRMSGEMAATDMQDLMRLWLAPTTSAFEQMMAAMKKTGGAG